MTILPCLSDTQGRLLITQYVVPKDVFLTDTGGQALNIFPHSPAPAQMTVIVKSYVQFTL